MPNKKTNHGGWWVRMKHLMKTNTGLVNIIAAALLVELVSGVMYYSAQNIIHRTVERLIDREMNAIYLCIRNNLAKVEVTVDNMAWVVKDGLTEPDLMFDISQRMVKNNPSFWGSGVAFVPNYYPQKDKFFEPYAVRRGQDSIVSMQLGSDGVDHTQDEYFRVPVTTGKAHWSEPYLDMNGAKKIITTYGVPIRDNKDSIAGIVYADISLDWLEEVVEEGKLYKSTQRFIVTGKGHLLAGKDDALFRMAMKLVKADDDKIGNVTMEDEKGNEHHVFFHPVGGHTDWILINVLNDADVFTKLRRIRGELLLLVLSGLILIGFIVWRSSRNMERLRKVNAEKNRIDGELRVASEIQQSMLPKEEVSGEWLEVRGSLKPAREVGGDLYDYFIRDEKLFFCIGDVSGKGAPSAMVMGVIHSLFRAFSAHENNPARIMQAINESACQGNDTNIFVTMFIGVLDLPTGHLRYCNAGHDAPMIIRGEGQEVIGERIVQIPVQSHLPIGVFDDVKYEIQEMNVEPDSSIFLYTDGLTEAMNKEHKLFGMNRVEAVLGTCVGMQTKDILQTITQAVLQFVDDAEQSDDLTMLAIHYTPVRREAVYEDQLTLQNDVHQVKQLNAFVKQTVGQLQIEASLAKQLQLAVEEAVVNVMEYAYPAGETGDVTIKMMSDGSVLRIQIIDRGVYFDPTAKEKADIDIPVQDRQIGGLGILLVRELMDSINYERINQLNILSLTKKYKSL